MEAHRVDLATEAGVAELYRHIANTGRPVESRRRCPARAAELVERAIEDASLVLKP